MSEIRYIWQPPSIASLPIQGKKERLPVNRLFFVGRNYHAHALEMNAPVDKSVDPAFYFIKSPQTLVYSGGDSGVTIKYPPQTKDYHYEMELVVAIGAPGFEVRESEAHKLIYGYACGLDMTRRDLQTIAKNKGRPWDLGKNFEEAAICSEIVPMEGRILREAHIELKVNGEVKQSSDTDKMIWSIAEIISDLSRFYHLEPGDLIYTGTPEGVGPVVSGDRLEGLIERVGSITLNIA